jgi:tetratricopeptide (TPR) repeat protein
MIVIENSKRLSVSQELELHRAAFARNSRSVPIRARLAMLMVQTNLYAEVMALLEGRQDLLHLECMLLIHALLAQKTAEADRRVCQFAVVAEATASMDQERAIVFAQLGKAQMRLGDDAARSSFEQALAIDPTNKDACKRLASWLFSCDDPQAVLDFSEKAFARGAAHPVQFAARVMALASLGRFDEAHQLDGRQQLGMADELPPPPGWASIHEFNIALAEELSVHPRLQFERPGTASESTWRIDSMPGPDASLARILFDQIRQQIDRHIADLGNFDHAWLKVFPKAGILSGSCLIVEGDGYERWHMHEHGSTSGVYYVTAPEDMTSITENGGGLAFGLPPEIVGDRAADGFGLDLIRPRAGMLQLFPSHSYHRTYPHLGQSKRICVAFDLRPK